MRNSSWSCYFLSLNKLILRGRTAVWILKNPKRPFCKSPLKVFTAANTCQIITCSYFFNLCFLTVVAIEWNRKGGRHFVADSSYNKLTQQTASGSQSWGIDTCRSQPDHQSHTNSKHLAGTPSMRPQKASLSLFPSKASLGGSFLPRLWWRRFWCKKQLK